MSILDWTPPPGLTTGFDLELDFCFVLELVFFFLFFFHLQ